MSYVYITIPSSQGKSFWLAPLYPTSTYWQRFKHSVRVELVELKQSEDDLLIVSVVTKYRKLGTTDGDDISLMFASNQ